MSDYLPPAEVRRLLLGIDGPDEDAEVLAIEKGILRPDWREVKARADEEAET